ncbi:SRPBCC family protein [Actinoplanes oblitus]|uniref:SRPBCC family protein n=1 Tax=Actinoplanes oblitus TaxID=3040509 RepID=A0ABY8WBE5_9ACTN|nr:SRPBCC family protein [Actinoplanes oblitus]WIM93719.1 SRPBCC family protein [Actinoplanes oblitus]
MIDVTEQINNVRRTLGDRILEAGAARVLTISQVYDTDLDDMWDVVSNPERIARWFLPVSGDLREGGKYQFEGQAGGTITRCDKPLSVAATWEFGGQVSWVEVRLTPEGDGRTRFELEHTAPIDEHWDRFGPGAVGIGWDMAVWGLANHLAAPDVPLDKDAAMAWMVSADGKRFMKLSSDAWAAADLALGTDPADVDRRAAATFAAYTATE